MENFFINNELYRDIGDYIWQMEDDEVMLLPDDWTVEAFESYEEPIFELSTGWIMEHIDEERFPEEGTEYSRIEKLLSSKINYAEINAEIPKLYYETKKKFTITKADLLEYLK